MVDSPRNSNALSSAEIDENNEAGTFNQIEDALREKLGTIISEQAADSDGCEYMFSKLIFRKGAELYTAS